MELCPDVTRFEEEFPVRISVWDQFDLKFEEINDLCLQKEESLEDVLKQLVQNRPGLLQRLKVIRVESKDNPPSLKQQYSEMLSQDKELLKDFCRELKHYREDPEPSCVSMKSDRTKNIPPSFNQQHSKSEQNRADSPEPSCVSMKSDRSKDIPLSFNQQHSTESSDVSTDRRSPLDSIFMGKSQSEEGSRLTRLNCLEENVVGFVKKELKKFKEMLSPDYPECPEDQCEDEEVVDEEEAQRRYSSKLVLDMTLLFMRRMNQGELAASLEKRSMRLSRSVAENTKQNAAFPDLMSAIRMVFSTCFG